MGQPNMKNTVSQSTFGTYHKTAKNKPHKNAIPKTKNMSQPDLTKKPVMNAGAQNNSSHKTIMSSWYTSTFFFKSARIYNVYNVKPLLANTNKQ